MFKYNTDLTARKGVTLSDISVLISMSIIFIIMVKYGMNKISRIDKAINEVDAIHEIISEDTSNKKYASSIINEINKRHFSYKSIPRNSNATFSPLGGGEAISSSNGGITTLNIQDVSRNDCLWF